MQVLKYGDLFQEEAGRHREEIKQIAATKPLLDIANRLLPMWSENISWRVENGNRAADLTYASGIGTINCFSINLRLGENDTITKDVAFILDELMNHPDLEFECEDDYIDMGWRGWKFKYIGWHKRSLHWLRKSEPRLLLRAWFEQSTKCKKVGTGKFEEVMEVVCE